MVRQEGFLGEGTSLRSKRAQLSSNAENEVMGKEGTKNKCQALPSGSRTSSRNQSGRRAVTDERKMNLGQKATGMGDRRTCGGSPPLRKFVAGE